MSTYSHNGASTSRISVPGEVFETTHRANMRQYWQQKYRNVKMWDATSGAYLQTLNVVRFLYSLLLDPTSLYLLTESGSFYVGIPMVSSIINVTKLQYPLYLYAGFAQTTYWLHIAARTCSWCYQSTKPLCSSVCGICPVSSEVYYACYSPVHSRHTVKTRRKLMLSLPGRLT
jgi:hypothetical protein